MSYIYTDDILDTDIKRWRDKERSEVITEKFGFKMDLSKLNESQQNKETLNEEDCWGTKKSKVANIYKEMPVSKKKTSDGYHEISYHEGGEKKKIVLESLSEKQLDEIYKQLKEKLVDKPKKIKADKVGNHEADKDWEDAETGMKTSKKHAKKQKGDFPNPDGHDKGGKSTYDPSDGEVANTTDGAADALSEEERKKK